MQTSAPLDGQRLAVLFKYYLQFETDYIRPVPEQRIRAQQLYHVGKASFDKLAALLEKHPQIRPENYIRFLVHDLRLTDRSDPAEIASRRSFSRYLERLQSQDKRRMIYGYIVKSARNMADMCLEMECTPLECLAQMIKQRRLAALCMCGKISKYFLAAIPGFDKVVGRLDSISRDELSDVASRYDMYNTAANDAFLFFRNRKVNPAALVEAAIREKINGKTGGGSGLSA